MQSSGANLSGTACNLRYPSQNCKPWSWHCQNTPLATRCVTFNWVPPTHCTTAWSPVSLQCLECERWKRKEQGPEEQSLSEMTPEAPRTLCWVIQLESFFWKTAHNLLWRNSKDKNKWVPCICACSNLPTPVSLLSLCCTTTTRFS